MSDAFSIPAPEIGMARLRLRGLSMDDAPAIFRYASDPEVARFTLWPPHKSEEFTRGFLRLFTQPGCLSWALVPQGEEVAVGMVLFHTFSKYHQRASSPLIWRAAIGKKASLRKRLARRWNLRFPS